MNNKRLLAIASLVNKDDYIIDIGCDHAYLDIYLVKNNLCKGAIATDISECALNQAQKNIKKYKLENKIKVLQSDGLQNIDIGSANTVVISGMGAFNILGILDSKKIDKIKKIIIQSNNNLDILRTAMQKRKYKIDRESIIFDRGKYYTIISYKKGFEKLDFTRKNIGILDKNNSLYYKYVINHNNELLNRIPRQRVFERLKIKKINKVLKKYIETL